ncbi:MAG: S46 family peptidase [Myxococcota bacterium]
MLALVLSLLAAPVANADEGMWLPEQIPEIAPAWTERGLEIDPEALADPLGKPLGAIVSLGFCSASFVSPDGLIATNHHCVEGFLQQNSTGANNLHKDGFVAADRTEELPVGPGGRIQVVEKIEDVTSQVMRKVGKRTKDAKRYTLMEEAKKRLIAACERQANRRCRVASYRGGGEYRLITSLELADVRIVAAPPMSVGQFGGEIDNWMWPRHSADFSFLRAYVAPDGSSATYSKDNVPYKPAHHLEVDATGAEPGSFVMIAGYPGRTSRHARAESLRWYSQDYLPTRLQLTLDMRQILQTFSDADPDAEARLGRSISSLSNGIKNSQGLLEGLQRGGLVDEKIKNEAEILAWVNADPARAKKWKAALETQSTLNSERQADSLRELYVSWAGRAADLLSVSRRAVRWAGEREKSDIQRDRGYQDRDRERIEAGFDRLERSLHLPSDRAVFELVMSRYQALPKDSRVQVLDDWIEANGGIKKAMDRLYAEPTLTDADARKALLNQSVAELKASDDPWVELAVALEEWDAPRRAKSKARSGASLKVTPAWFQVLDAWHKEQGKVLYDDANSTLRLTLGHVEGYSPQDGLVALPQTTVAGLAVKAGPAPFNAPEALVERARDSKDHRFADKALGAVPASFLSTLDITGGNSGSAVLNGKGQLVGLVFDGNYESIAADWIWMQSVTRAITVDVRMIGWVLDGDPKAAWILKELGL